jgi:hypothetical protein
MRTQFKPAVNLVENALRTVVQTASGFWQRARAGERSSVFAPDQNAALLPELWRAKSGVPFSPLND